MPSMDDLELPKGLNFGALLHFLLKHGVRPQGATEQGHRWTREIFGERIGRSEKQVRNWLANKSVPNIDDPVVSAIERVFFGSNQTYRFDWRIELRESIGRSRLPSVPDEKNGKDNSPTENFPSVLSVNVGRSRLALLDVTLNTARPNEINVQPLRDVSADSMTFVAKIAEVAGYPSIDWLRERLPAWYERVTGKPLKFDLPADDSNWLSQYTWDRMNPRTRSYDDSWIWEVLYWYHRQDFWASRWHREKTCKTRRPSINLTIRNMGDAPATGTVLEAKIYGDDGQELYSHELEDISGVNGLSGFGRYREWSRDWYVDKSTSCEISERPEPGEFKIISPIEKQYRLCRPIWYGEEDHALVEYDFAAKFKAKITLSDDYTSLIYRCKAPEDIVHHNSLDCPGFYVNLFDQHFDYLMVDYRVHSRDQKRLSTGTIKIKVNEIKPEFEGSDPWISFDDYRIWGMRGPKWQPDWDAARGPYWVTELAEDE